MANRWDPYHSLICWTEFGHPKTDTGLYPYVLDHLWFTYCGESTPIEKPHYLYELFCYLKQRPMVDNIHSLGISRWLYHYRLKPHIAWLASVIREIHWSDRLSPYNHSIHFQKRVTGID
jgi:hypothetical protein